jgi:hypothetical protein
VLKFPDATAGEWRPRGALARVLGSSEDARVATPERLANSTREAR